ncbi:glycosyltransferase involved in cell wall biosynthesis [Malaciobacter marinus]|jgi:glycosyltransferase involved in cell wall biosynthesis|uniref:Glycosyltransferase involved in cell wall biosynthesis n=1 Tax=Malaciobacter marinus TaxID=505249 RepID=A0AB36ZTR9_9BACT|nr:glycosyltransferase family 4 protein [Malaciobacter marinus]PPK59169.1 glycosyltransferase involved in cell wall biosynthesis [Malaciobacter marinus]
MKKKVLIVSEVFYPEEFKINELAIDWKNKGYDVDILTMVPSYPSSKIFDGYENRWYQKELWNGMNIYRVKAVTGYKNSLFKKLLKYFAFMIMGSFLSIKIGKKYDYIFGFQVGPLTAMVPAIILKQFYKKPVTLWIQDIWPDSVYAYGFKKTKILEFFLNSFVRYVYKNTSSFGISAKGFEKKIIPFLSENKEIFYAPNWADYLDKDLERIRFSHDDKIHFTFAGNIGSVQNLENIIESFGKIDDKYLEKAQLNIIGDGSHLEKLQNIVKENSFKNIIFWGRKPRGEIYKYLSASNFLIVSLIDKEIFSLTVPAKTQTYIATGKPIIAIIKGEAADIIRENELGLVCNPDSLEEIKSVFIEAIEMSDEKSKKYIKNSELLTNTIFKKELILDNLLELLKRV